MVQLRRNHTQQNKGLQTTFRLAIFFFLAVFALTAGLGYFKKYFNTLKSAEEKDHIDVSLRTYLPVSKGEIVHHTYYSLAYDEHHEQAEWVAYLMTKDMLKAPNVPRHPEFLADDAVKTGSAKHKDYSNSGYTRGHLAPAGDMAFDQTAMKESFYMSNVSPQLRQFNNGVWKELEESIRDWTYAADTIYIVTGPILKDSVGTIGKENRVTVPSAFYKVLLVYRDNEKEAVGFIIPHAISDQRLEEYMVTVDDVERMTGIDFFGSMIGDTEEEKLESAFHKEYWKTSEKRYQLRVKKWNYD